MTAKKWTKFRLLCALHDLWDEMAREPTLREMREWEHGPGYSQVWTREFGGWYPAVEIAMRERRRLSDIPKIIPSVPHEGEAVNPNKETT